MHLISYISDSALCHGKSRSEVNNIVKTAQANNANRGITGVLFFANNHFFQTIEGEKETLFDLYDTIKQDERHHEVRTLIDQPIRERAFGDWSLDGFFVDNHELINPQTISMLRSIYMHNFGADASGLIEFVKKMIDEMDTFKILSEPFDDQYL